MLLKPNIAVVIASISSGLKYYVFRYINVAGADKDAEIGEFHKPETHLIPLVLETIAGKRDSITIFGTDYNTNDGTCIRDYVHVRDLAYVHVSAIYFLQYNEQISLRSGPQSLS